MDDISETQRERHGLDTTEAIPIKIAWISAHSDVYGNELADGKAKLAAKGKTSAFGTLPPLLRSPLPRNTSAIKQEFHERLSWTWKVRWKNSPRFDRFTRNSHS